MFAVCGLSLPARGVETDFAVLGRVALLSN
jgi:hypothetical protein